MVQAASLEEEPCKEEEELSCSAGEALAGTPVGGAEGQRSSENQQNFKSVFQSSHNQFFWCTLDHFNGLVLRFLFNNENPFSHIKRRLPTTHGEIKIKEANAVFLSVYNVTSIFDVIGGRSVTSIFLSLVHFVLLV